YYDQGPVRSQIWAAGLRNPLGIAFDGEGRLWELEMGPAHGDELNLIERGANYGYPLVSNGDHYDGRDIPDHSPNDGFAAPVLWWNPAISPGAMMIYTGSAFPAWQGDAFIAALSGQALIRVDLDGTSARQANRWDTGFRVRDVTQGNDGAVWILEDGGRRGQGRLFRIAPSGVGAN
ncbi:MAG: PQQ-dependent sugar dehydrogenase, partial [Sphingopyxis sp.]|nr:PQQ-dependent sugar dehydrogenase [Sphingopyxis sp.]